MYIVRSTAWVLLFLALAGWGAECLYSLQAGTYHFLTPVDLWQVISPESLQAFTDNNSGFVLDGLGMVFLHRPIWLLPAITCTTLFIVVRRRKKK